MVLFVKVYLVGESVVCEDLPHVSLAIVAHLVVAGEDQALQAMLIGFQVEG
jgi:hypothetical protein